jgi:hypothetical protein
MPTQPTSTWSQIKIHLKQMEKDDLILLLHDLHALNAENKLYLAAHVQAASPDEIAAPFRAQIEVALDSDPRHFRLNFADAVKALNRYKHFTKDPLLLVKMMLHLLDRGMPCITNNSGVADRTIIGVGRIYEEAAALTCKIDDPSTINALRADFESLVRDAEEVDWGLYESMMDVFLNYLPQEEIEEEESGVT